MDGWRDGLPVSTLSWVYRYGGSAGSRGVGCVGRRCVTGSAGKQHDEECFMGGSVMDLLGWGAGEGVYSQMIIIITNEFL